MTRVLVDARVVSEHLDGLSRYTLGLVGALAQRRDLRLALLIPASLSDGHALRRLINDHGLQATDSPEPFLSPLSHLRISRTLRLIGCDVYHYPHFNLPVGAPGRNVVTVHDLTPLRHPDYFRRFSAAKRVYFWLATAYAAAKAEVVIVPSHATAAELARAVPWAAHKTHVVSEGVDASFRQRPEPSELRRSRERYRLDDPFLLYVGVDRPHKNLRRLLRAFGAIAGRVPHRLLLVGRHVDRLSLRALADGLGLGDRVRWLGYVPHEDLRCLYVLADAFVLCSVAEGFGLGVIEAMASGAPVVVSDRGAASEVAGEAAIRVDPHSAESIAEGLFAVCTEPLRRDQLRTLGRQRAAVFTWERAASETSALYRGTPET